MTVRRPGVGASRQAGHIMTYLAPWLLGGGIIGGLVIGGGLGVLIGAGVTLAAFVLIEAGGSAYMDYADARRARRSMAAWVPGDGGGLALASDARLLDGYDHKIPGTSYFSGVTNQYPLFGIDIGRKCLALASGDRFTPVEGNEIRCWRRAEQPADRLFVVELVTPAPDHPGRTRVKRIEVKVRSDEDAASLDDALRRALGDPSGG